ncbi:hypothetical protein MSG28_010932 [Choristoneura fumiferana]|uniref:Uncharacterized protein n=1 Tax=Choristoneura fumiferana TaxID=7141 RepID=A0ACC0KPD2_CHOFU|nr:hypothetical protein MSG28_010932 [Choristoneura fumiferana]
MATQMYAKKVRRLLRRLLRTLRWLWRLLLPMHHDLHVLYKDLLASHMLPETSMASAMSSKLRDFFNVVMKSYPTCRFVK